LKAWEKVVDAVLGVAASAILFVLMAMTFVDVVSRYVFNRPLSGTFEITELMLLVLIFAGLPLVSHANEHVTMDFIDKMLGERARGMLDRAVNAICAAAMLVIAWQIWVKATRIASYGDTTDVVRIPIAPFVYFMSVMVVLTALVHVYRVFVPSPPTAPPAGAS
jgi:TRAP-type C4-dicarboxylate transport system permease small subunit